MVIYVACILKIKHAYKIFAEGKKEAGYVDWIQLFQDKVQWWTLVNIKDGEFLEQLVDY
jgi:hypothetical protein